MKAYALIASVHDVLQQGLMLLMEVDGETYKTVADAPHSASIGQHYRHVLDHFICLADGIASGVIDYDSRSRNRALETNRESARETTIQLSKLFSSLSARQIAASHKVLYSVGYSNDEALEIETVLAREIAFCVSHAIHHFAIIRLVCAHFSIELPQDYGVAPSTLKYRAAQMNA
ncbi:MAG TPA: hypothetical protein VF135_14995 [Terriglobales bacterium]